MTALKSNKNYVIPIFIPELACPFQCLYCDQRKISGKMRVAAEDEVIQTINSYLKTIPEKSNIELGYFGGNFTGIPKAKQEKYLALAQPFLKDGSIQNIRLSTRPDYINPEVLELLKMYKVGTIELGAQSMDDKVLIQSKRGHTVADTNEAAKLIRKFNFNLGLQMMIGLPGDSKEKAVATAKKIVELDAENTRIYPTLIIKGTALEKMFKQGKYKPLSLKEAVGWTAEIVEIFEQAKVKILRVGLHPSEGLLDGSDLVAGPFHLNFREMVLTEIWRKKLDQIKIKGESLTISVNPKELNFAVGYSSSNKIMLQQRFKKLKLITDEKIRDRNYELDHH